MATKIETSATGSVETVAAAPLDVSSFMGTIDIAELVRQQVESALAADKRSRNETPVVEASQRGTGPVTPAKYLKHYRCDVSPDVIIQRRSVNSDGTLGPVMKGERMVFRRGHFFATEQGEVDQLQWMMNHPQFDPLDPSRVIGGNPTIYEDDGRDLIQCLHCTEVFVRGSNAYKSHLRATHNIA